MKGTHEPLICSRRTRAKHLSQTVSDLSKGKTCRDYGIALPVLVINISVRNLVAGTPDDGIVPLDSKVAGG